MNTKDLHAAKSGEGEIFVDFRRETAHFRTAPAASYLETVGYRELQQKFKKQLRFILAAQWEGRPNFFIRIFRGKFAAAIFTETRRSFCCSASPNERIQLQCLKTMRLKFALVERWAKAVREENREAIRADHDPGILMSDVPPPFLSLGLDAYMKTWEAFFSSAEKPVAFALHDVQVTCGEDVAFATAIGRCVNIDTKGKREPLEFRLTMGLRKIDGRWRICTNITRCRPRRTYGYVVIPETRTVEIESQ